ncbi:MAG: type IV secretory system conjugative DNA transfer family protein [Bacilli bacterium]|nr:type IV secretory system conjugative DNA transfer family protein [Bacilli bacterium]
MAQYKTFSSLSAESYIKENLEDGRIIDYRDLPEKDVTYVDYKDLPKTEIKGFPFCSDFVDNRGKTYSTDEFLALPEEKKAKCKLRYAFMKNYHELYVGTTGSGKTTGCMEPQIRAVSSQKNKPNLFITDPKGELFNHNARHLKKMGYNLFVLNFKDFTKTHRWNPLEELYNLVSDIRKIGKGIRQVAGKPDSKVTLVVPEAEYKSSYYEYEGKAYPSKNMLMASIDVEKFSLISKATSLANQFASSMIPVQSNKDPVWEEGSRGLLFAILMLLFYDALDEKKKLTKDMFTLKTVSDTFGMIRTACTSNNQDAKRKLAKLEEGRPLEVLEKLHAVTQTADGTMKGFLSTFESRMTPWFSGHIFFITSGTTINIEDDSAPFAIFIATRDYDKSDFTIAATFVDWVYRQTLLKAENAPKNDENEPLVRDTHFLLDEFGNIPKIPDFENKIATARSRKIWFHLFVQSYEQIDLVYGKEGAQIVIDNCNQQAFLGSQSMLTKKRFSDECGSKTIRSYESLIKGTYSWTTVPVVPTSDLDLIKPGEIFIKRIYSPVVKGGYIRSYVCAKYGYFEDFRDEYAVRDFAPFNSILPNDEEHTYKGVRTYKKEEGLSVDLDEEDEEEEIEEIESEEETKESSSELPFDFPSFNWKAGDDSDE